MKLKEYSKTEPHPSWTEQEKWVWSRISEGEVADFNSSEYYGGKLDPKKPEEWTESRILTPAFLETILLHKPYREALTHHGIVILGAWFKDPIDLSNTTLAHQLIFGISRFDSNVKLNSLRTTHSILLRSSIFSEVVLRGAKIGDQLSMIGSKFTGKLDMDSLEVKNSLTMRGGAEFKEVVLRSAKIGGQTDMTGSKFTGKLEMGSLEANSSLLMSEAEFKEVVLLSAKIGGQLSMIGSKFTGKLDMNSLEVESSLIMRGGAEFKEVDIGSANVGGQTDMTGSKFTGKLEMGSLEANSSLLMSGAEFKEVDLTAAKIGGQLSIIGSKFTGQLIMDSLEAGSHIFMSGGAEFNEVILVAAKIGGGIDISNSKFKSLKMDGTQVKKELRLGSKEHLPTKWDKNSKLMLRNAEVGAIQDLSDAWPDELELVGFTYSQLSGLGAGKSHSMTKKDILGRKVWLNKQKSYSPQPYEQLGKVLREAGYKNEANDILYEGKMRELRESNGLTWMGLFLQLIVVGFGYRYRFAFIWVIALTFIGAFVLRATGQGLANGMPCGFAYSIDMLLPIIRLNESHYTVRLVGFAKYYFYFHIISGYALASFLIAGLSGITKK